MSLKPFVALAAAGLLACFIVHVCSWAGVPNPLAGHAWAMLGGLAVVGIKALNVAEENQRKHGMPEDVAAAWKLQLGGCPPWMVQLVRGIFFYAFAHFFFCLWKIRAMPLGATPMAYKVRVVTGHGMIAYAMALGVLFSADKQAGTELTK
jgi:hypothetical protein